MFKHTVTMDTFGERIIKRNPSSMMSAERRITADQILHLCRLLADQSRTKSFDRRRIEEDCSSSMEIQSEDITSSRSSDQEFCDRINTSECQNQERILSHDDQINPSEKITTTTTPVIKQVKKDILNKIRNQIFERKRQKLVTVQKKRTVSSAVWRPW
ncbi:uncharacterized protein LOC129911901 [Episyrphus balteatus]|uniref:uncharacterized protein LOC129911901 n=1 Tax=Episyrphus balteatus TaxID=286459 RepID=UPI00248627E5|nr:uncharacterized protein LOC129911901 [Episyrphus balteatus]